MLKKNHSHKDQVQRLIPITLRVKAYLQKAIITVTQIAKAYPSVPQRATNVEALQRKERKIKVQVTLEYINAIRYRIYRVLCILMTKKPH
jgi:hypothetical protein